MRTNATGVGHEEQYNTYVGNNADNNIEAIHC